MNAAFGNEYESKSKQILSIVVVIIIALHFIIGS